MFAVATRWPSSIMRRNSLFLQQIGTLESGLRRVHEEESKQKRRPARRNDGHNGCGLGMLPRLAKRKYLDGSGRGPCRNCGWAPTNHRLCNCARHQCGTRSVACNISEPHGLATLACSQASSSSATNVEPCCEPDSFWSPFWSPFIAESTPKTTERSS